MSYKKHMMPFFSVVIPTYNSEEFIEKTLSSAIDQTHKNYEIIISDDGSKDKTVELVQSIFKNSPHIQYKLYSNDHHGPGVARNKGIDEAEGEWISFLDSDDIWFPKKLQKVATYINNNKNVDLICNNKIYKSANKTTLLNCSKKFNHKINPLLALYREKALITSAVTAKKKLIQQAGLFDETLPAGQDYELWLRISLIKNVNFGFIDEPLGLYVNREGSISSNYKQRLKCELAISKKYFKYLSKVTKYPNIERLRYEGRLYASLGLRLLRVNQVVQGSTLFMIGIFKWPFRFDWVNSMYSMLKKN